VREGNVLTERYRSWKARCSYRHDAVTSGRIERTYNTVKINSHAFSKASREVPPVPTLSWPSS
jgi:hypothetical protein